jgi:hypothetical protein
VQRSAFHARGAFHAREDDPPLTVLPPPPVEARHDASPPKSPHFAWQSPATTKSPAAAPRVASPARTLEVFRGVGCFDDDEDVGACAPPLFHDADDDTFEAPDFPVPARDSPAPPGPAAAPGAATAPRDAHDGGAAGGREDAAATGPAAPTARQRQQRRAAQLALRRPPTASPEAHGACVTPLFPLLRPLLSTLVRRGPPALGRPAPRGPRRRRLARRRRARPRRPPRRRGAPSGKTHQETHRGATRLSTRRAGFTSTTRQRTARSRCAAPPLAAASRR